MFYNEKLHNSSNNWHFTCFGWEPLVCAQSMQSRHDQPCPYRSPGSPWRVLDTQLTLLAPHTSTCWAVAETFQPSTLRVAALPSQFRRGHSRRCCCPRGRLGHGLESRVEHITDPPSWLSRKLSSPDGEKTSSQKAFLNYQVPSRTLAQTLIFTRPWQCALVISLPHFCNTSLYIPSLEPPRVTCGQWRDRALPPHLAAGLLSAW